MKIRNSAGDTNRLVVFAAVGIFVALCIAVSYVFYNKDTGPKQKIVSVTSNSDDVSNALYEKDSDGDGLADWEEILWSTDPDNPDSDGDGVPDKADVYNESSNGDMFGNLNSSSTEDVTATQKLARDFFKSFMTSLQGGTYTSPEEQEKWVQDSLRSAGPLLEKAPSYDPSEMKIVTSTQENRVRYVHEVQAIAAKMLTDTPNEHVALMMLTQGEREKSIADLKKAVEHYSIYTEQLRFISIPKDAGVIHAAMMRALLFYIFTLDGFTVVESDPLQTALSAKNLPYAKENLNKAFTDFRSYIEQYRIPQNPELL